MKSGVHHFSYVLFLSLAMSLFHSVFPGSLNEISHWNEKKIGVKRNRRGSRQVMRIKKINKFRDNQYQFLQITITRIVWQIIRRITDMILGAIVLTCASLLINGDDWKWASKHGHGVIIWNILHRQLTFSTEQLQQTTEVAAVRVVPKKRTVASYCEQIFSQSHEHH